MRVGRRRVGLYGRRPRRGGAARLVIGLGIALFSLISFFASKEYNPVTGEHQFLSLTPRQEIALGLQAAPQMAERHGGLHRDPQLRDLVDRVGNRIVRDSAAASTAWRFEFHLLADPRTVNAFALPGGQVFVTYALFSRFETEGQLASVLGHEIGHVVARHSAQRMAKSQLTSGLLGAVAAASESHGTTRMAAMVGQMINMSYGRDDEIESDLLGVRFMSEARYDPRAAISVMKILAEAGGGRQPEFFSTHPNPDNRVRRIEEAIARAFPQGVPQNLEP